MNGLGFFAPELCQTYVQSQPELPTLSLVPAKPTVISNPVVIGGIMQSGFLCAFNRWVSENPILSGAGLAASYFLLRRKR